MDKERNEIINKLVLIYKKYNPRSKPKEDSQLCLLWSVDDPPDILVNTEQLDDIEEMFEIDIDEDNSILLYDMTLSEASEFIQQLIVKQNGKSNSFKL